MYIQSYSFQIHVALIRYQTYILSFLLLVAHTTVVHTREACIQTGTADIYKSLYRTVPWLNLCSEQVAVSCHDKHDKHDLGIQLMCKS